MIPTQRTASEQKIENMHGDFVKYHDFAVHCFFAKALCFFPSFVYNGIITQGCFTYPETYPSSLRNNENLPDAK